MNYQDLYDRIMNVSGPNAPIAYKEQALRSVAGSLVHNDQADFSLRFRASSTLAALDGPNFEEGERELFIKNELVDIKNELKKKMEKWHWVAVRNVVERRARRTGPEIKRPAKLSKWLFNPF
jgi:hypothetical protein